jgi:dihydrodipicolinate synthase/N-acetylneuraminate lyase
MSQLAMPPGWALDALRSGLVIPAHPLALTNQRKLDERRQRALTRYYHAAGAGGIAVGVHTTQFAIREPKHGLFEPVLRIAAETVRACDSTTGRKTVLVAGICGLTTQAVAEARLARELGYHAGLLSLAALQKANEDELIAHCRAVAQEIALFGFYLQPAVGGRILPLSFWHRFLEIPNVVAIKIAPFNRYQTLDVLRAVAEVGRVNDVALYTGNDDHIVLDLLTRYAVPTSQGIRRVHIVGGLLGQWACGTRLAVRFVDKIKRARAANNVPMSLFTLASHFTDFNAAVFDAGNCFSGCIPGIHEVLRRQGLLANTLCLDPTETLSPGQAEEIDRVYIAYPHLRDYDFIAAHLAEWF